MKTVAAPQIRIPSSSWEFLPWQRGVWNSAARNKLINAGRGSGKDIICLRCALRDAFEIYGRKSAARAAGERFLVLNPVVRGVLAGPTEENVKQLRADFRGELERLVDDVNRERDEGDQIRYDQFFQYVAREDKFVLYDRGEIEFDVVQTSTRGCFRGSGIDVMVYTEFAFGRREAYQDELPGTLKRAGRAGIQYLNSTPWWTADCPDAPSGGMWHDLVGEVSGGHREPEGVEAALSAVRAGRVPRSLYYDVEHPERPDAWAFFYASSFDNDFLTDEQRAEILAEVKKSEATFQRERFARFTMPEGKGNPAFLREVVLGCLVDRPDPAPPGGYAVASRGEVDPRRARRDTKGGGQPVGQVRIGTDLARFGDDETVLLAIDDESGLVLGIEILEMSSGPQIVEGMKRQAERWPGCQFEMDTQAHQAFVRDFCPRELNINEHKIRDNERYVLGLKALLEMKRIRIPNPDSESYPFAGEAQREACRKLVYQLVQYQKVEKQGERVKYTHAPGQHDDLVTALYMAAEPIARACRGRVDADKTKRRIARLLV